MADRKPNILLIMTDQQHARMMSCAGNEWLKTPAMLAALEPAYGLFLRFRPSLQRFAGGSTAGPACHACELDDGHATAGDNAGDAEASGRCSPP